MNATFSPSLTPIPTSGRFLICRGDPCGRHTNKRGRPQGSPQQKTAVYHGVGVSVGVCKSALILLLLIFSRFLVLAQSPEEVIDFNRIPQKAIRDLVRKENVKTATDFQHIATSCYRAEDSSGYQTNLKTYVVKARINKVWEKYINITPGKAWNGHTVKFGFLFSKPNNQFIYAENANEPIRVGNIIYVNLRLLRGLKNLGVGFEITRLDEQNKTICFCYLQDGVSNGSQEIRFTELANGDTRISHLTHYKSHSQFRDKELYPIFHSKFVGEFHENILSQIERGS